MVRIIWSPPEPGAYSRNVARRLAAPKREESASDWLGVVALFIGLVLLMAALVSAGMALK